MLTGEPESKIDSHSRKSLGHLRTAALPLPKRSKLSGDPPAGVSDEDEAAFHAMMGKLEELKGRLARYNKSVRALRAQVALLVGEELILLPSAIPPIAMTAEGPEPSVPRKRGRGRKTTASVVQVPASPKPLAMLVPRPIRIDGGEALCAYGDRTIRLLLFVEGREFASGLVAEVTRIASTRFRGLAVKAVVEIPQAKRRRRKKKFD